MELTTQQKQDYLKSGGSHCPFCKSDDIEAIGGFDFEASQVWESVKCNACDSEWRDVYTLIEVENI